MAVWRNRTAGVTAAAGLLSLALAVGGCAEADGGASDDSAAENDSTRQHKRALESTSGPFDYGLMREQASSDEARRAIRRCGEGAADACYQLGVYYHGGDGIVRNNDRSNRLIEYACDRGSTRACYDMGVRLYRGTEMDQNLAAARPYFQSTCSEGMKEGCHMLGRMVRRGLGGPRNVDRARRLFRRACRLGSKVDCERLKSPIRTDTGTHEQHLPDDAPDPLVDAARKCDSGLMSGCTRLARAYELGDGVGQSFERAHELYRLACDWGKLDACEVFRMMEGTANRFD